MSDGEKGVLIKCPKCGHEFGLAKPNHGEKEDEFLLECGDCIEKEARDKMEEGRMEIRRLKEEALAEMKKAENELEKSFVELMEESKDQANQRRAVLDGLNWIERYD